MRFALQRPWLILRDLLLNRDRPDLEGLRAIEDPERFVWSILPHAARTFSPCIALLPESSARAAAVAYLYCRVLDTYEDLSPDQITSESALLLFAERLERSCAGEELASAPGLITARDRDDRDRAHLLLVERCGLVDRMFLELPSEVRLLVRDLVRDMAEGMVWSSRTFADQGGVLLNEDQIRRYCRAVIGNPVVFTIRLLRYYRTGATDLEPELREHAMTAGEMVQLANITRDIEKDLRRGVAYRPELRDDLGADASADPEVADRVRSVRRRLLRMALVRVPSYRAVMRELSGRRVSPARASAILMLLYTDRYYRSCARRVGVPVWSGRSGSLALIAGTIPAGCSERFANRIADQVERGFLRAARAAE